MYSKSIDIYSVSCDCKSIHSIEMSTDTKAFMNALTYIQKSEKLKLKPYLAEVKTYKTEKIQ